MGERLRDVYFKKQRANGCMDIAALRGALPFVANARDCVCRQQ